MSARKLHGKKKQKKKKNNPKKKNLTEREREKRERERERDVNKKAFRWKILGRGGEVHGIIKLQSPSPLTNMSYQKNK